MRDEILRGVASTISVTFYVDGTATDPSPDAATLTITKDSDGSTLVEDATAVDADDTGKFTYTLDSTETADLDILHVAWTGVFNGQSQTLESDVEIVGDFLFDIAEARAMDTELANTDKYPAARIVLGRTMATRALEDICGVAFVPRYAKQTVSGRGGNELELRWPLVQAVRTASQSGTALTETELADITPTSLGAYWGTRWTAGTNNATLVYEHGYDQPPPMAARAGIRLCRHFLTQFPVDDRTTRFDTEVGSFTMAQPGVNGNTFGIPEVDAFIAAYSYAQGVY